MTTTGSLMIGKSTNGTFFIEIESEEGTRTLVKLSAEDFAQVITGKVLEVTIETTK